MQEFAKNYPSEDQMKDNPKEVGVTPPELKYTIDQGGEYRRYEMECQGEDCKIKDEKTGKITGKKFTRNIPSDWFNGKDEIKEHNLPETLDLKTVQDVFDNPLCGACQPETKKKLDALKAHNEQLKK